MFISEERLCSTGLRSSITLHQSLTHTSTLQCVSNNTHGTARKQLQLPLSHLQFADCQQSTVLLLIILTLILVLYALTVGLGLYKMRQLTMKLKAQNEAAGTYASLHLSAPPSEYDTLNIKRDCQQSTVSFLIILTLILVLYALTVGLGLYKMRQLSTVYGFILDHINTDSGSVRSTVGLELYKMRQLTMKLKVQNEAADTYASLQLSAPPSEYKTLNIKKDCQHSTVLLLIILTLILVLYALTVGLGLYKMRQLSTKLKAQNEAAGTYASLHLSAPPSEYDTLNIKRGDTQ
ncbi:sialic acid-binding Ig-like lectin 7 [Labeo rohita]|uniref:Sialic acid-binding Ig-like lectin 7 n=1 Tax=Labeo rohita TaxID=84645 RepID=A0A498NP56_LABRO|nr:sialic acid-binding Ig-like lectin 7 [Labeo rohita]